MKKNLTFKIILYTVIYTLAANSYALSAENGVYLIAAIFLALSVNLIGGFFSVSTIKARLRTSMHGAVILIVFQASAALSVVYQAIAGIFYIRADDWKGFIFSALYCIAFEALLFWNGIICVYLASYRLGLKTRVLGILCGFIPIMNIIMLNRIIKTVFEEARAETKRESLRAETVAKQLCDTKYPILLVHGVFFRDRKLLNYWGRIPKELKINGAKIYYGNHQSAASVADSAKELYDRIEKIVNSTGCGKLNVIAHSKGGLDCRYAMRYLGADKYIASLTTVNTPHRGCEFAEYLLEELPPDIVSALERFYNRTSKRLGDPSPDFLAAVKDLTAGACIPRDKEMALPEGVYCRSIGSVLLKASGGGFPMNFSYVLVKHFNGDNDGLVSEDSFKWGEDYTLLKNEHGEGISHCDIIDLARKDIDGFDVRDFYVSLVGDLKARGL
ncbi:MAG: triacylglycerol lipase [Clostridia bacterium]|nr:triacylglycerol lipase [Clostridia bacterium]